jgi:ankyrin repeat protein
MNEIKLINAIVKNDIEEAKKMISQGLDTDYIDSETNWTFLNFAIEHNCFEVVKLLVEHSANINLMRNSESGCPPIHHAIESAYDFYLQGNKTEPNTDIIEYLLSHNPDINMIDSFGNTPIHYANKHEKLKNLFKEKY